MKVGLIICSYNRPAYLRRCLESVAAADLSQVQTVLIIDDHSSDKETLDLINDFELPHVELIKALSKENRSIKYSLQFGFDLLFLTHKVCTNLDGDAIVSPDSINRLLEMHDKFPGHLITGFNCSTKNLDGSIRHKVLEQGVGWNKKFSVGGINLMFGKSEYAEIVKPALQKTLSGGGNWDHTACITSNNGHGKPIIVLEPSCVQHIGVEESSMGHLSGGEPADFAEDFSLSGYNQHEIDRYRELWKSEKENGLPNTPFQLTGKIQLPEVTLVGADCVDFSRLQRAADACEKHIAFGDSILFTSDYPKVGLHSDRRAYPIEKIKNKEEYSWFIMKQLAQHIKTSHMLIIQHDGFILNPFAWDDKWLEWDYIGAPFEWYPDEYKVGNGGFSLRSKKLMNVIANDISLIPATDGLNTHNEEDHCICRMYRKYLESMYGIRFAPVEVARRFSIEGWRSENKTWTNEFGFHGHGLTNVKP